MDRNRWPEGLRRVALLVGCALTLLAARAERGNRDLQRVKEAYRQLLLPSTLRQDTLLADFVQIPPETEMSDQVVVELHQRYPFDMDKIQGYLALLDDEGAWSDINYADTKRSGWEPKLHAERILELAKLYYSPGTRLYQSQEVMASLHRALGFWLSRRPRCLNWWYNEIGVPKTLGAAFVLLERELTAEEKEGAIDVMKAARFRMTGQNKVWLAGNVLIRALLQDDCELVQAARDTIASEICLGRKEGIQSDWSFHQHGAQQQFGNYGLSYLSGMAFYARLFRNTPFAFDARQMAILRSLVDEGYRWIVWNRHMDVSALGRQLFHHAQLHKAYGLAFAAADLEMDGFPRQGNPLVGHKHFGCSDYTVHRNREWMATVKMSSQRVVGTELINEDNLLGYYLGDGATFYYRRGDEYLDVFPLWDWRKVPGVTAYEDTVPVPGVKAERSNNRSALVGGYGDGQRGLTAMELDRDGLKACKAWLMSDRFVVCLGTGIRSDSALCVTTSIDQRMQREKLAVWTDGRWRHVGEKELLCRQDLRFFHDAMGYVVLGDTVVAEAGRRSGRWCDCMGMYRPATVEGEVVSLHIRHGQCPQGTGYLYIVLPACDRGEVERFNVSEEVRVLRNDVVAQVVQVPSTGSGYWIAVYQPQPLELDGREFCPSAPGVYYVELAAEGWKVCGAPFKQ